MTATPQKHLLFVVSAPSGAGKTSLCIEAVNRLQAIRFSVSHTTRPVRSGEEHGKNYFFVSPAEFEALLQQNKIAEWTEIYGNRYGTAKQTIAEAFAGGYDLLFDIDERGGRQLTDTYDDVATILVVPPSLAELRRRLSGRGTEDEHSLRRRLMRAKEEMAQMRWYKYIIVNDRFEDAVEQLMAIITAERCRRDHGIVEELLNEDDLCKG
ncbi:MAG: guanylate kinase [Deltaproteobacteria bacterium]|nr:guanylate kinase [Deltaproteobacteria bacterium]